MASNSKERNISIDDCFRNAKTLNFIPHETDRNDFISRADCYKGLVILMDTINNTGQSLPSDVEIHPVG